jgi:hypothetical protein
LEGLKVFGALWTLFMRNDCMTKASVGGVAGGDKKGDGNASEPCVRICGFDVGEYFNQSGELN